MADASEDDARTFHVETRFQKMARRPGGVPRNKAIAAAQTQLSELKPETDRWFDQEIRELIGVVRSGQASSFDFDWVDKAKIHSAQLRDSGSTMGYELLSFVANTLCDIFEAMDAGESVSPESISCNLDALLLCRQDRYRHLRPEQVPELTIGLRQVAGLKRAHG